MMIALAPPAASMNSDDEVFELELVLEEIALVCERAACSNVDDADQKMLTTKADYLTRNAACSAACSAAIVDLCDAYAILLPKTMGCVVCQYLHLFSLTSRRAHVENRQSQLRILKAIATEKNFNPKTAMRFIDYVMYPFNGKSGKNFYQQCRLVLQKTIQQLTNDDDDDDRA